MASVVRQVVPLPDRPSPELLVHASFEGDIQQALGTFLQALRGAHTSAVSEAKSQLAQLRLENQNLQERLGGGPGFIDKDARLISVGATTTTTATSRCANLEFEDILKVPNASDILKVPHFEGPGAVPFQDVVPGGSSMPQKKHLAWETIPVDQEQSAIAPRPPTNSVPATQTYGEANPTITEPQVSGMKQRRTIAAKIRMHDLMKQQEEEEHQQQEEAGEQAPDHGKTNRQTNAKSRLFPDKTEIMERVQETSARPEYKVTSMYHTEGFVQKMARDPKFESISLAVITINSLWLAIDVDHNPNPYDSPPFFQAVEQLFCIFFFAELCTRFLAFKTKRDCFKDAWFVFDLILVTLGIFETWVMALILTGQGSNAAQTARQGSLFRVFRLLRLARTARMARLLKAVPELMIMFKGMLVASHAVTCTIFLLGVVIYVFALIFRQLTDGMDVGDRLFPTVPATMGTLLLQGTLPDASGFLSNLSAEHVLLGALGLCFVVLAMLVVLNMLSGVLVNVVLVVADLEREQTDATFVRKSLAVILQLGDTDGDQMISQNEFDALLVNRDAARIFQQVNVDIIGLVELSDFIFSEGTEKIAFEDFFKLILKLRGTNSATVKDIVEMRKFVVTELSVVESYLASLIEQAVPQSAKASFAAANHGTRHNLGQDDKDMKGRSPRAVHAPSLIEQDMMTEILRHMP